ncbi:hypothetical protein JTB14_034001 [Gonioctena quinquepunctata]|nr:hypothetical protein JTB14_034001 [Gonioctena quinquepunctata]
MCVSQFIFFILLTICSSESAVFIWSNQPINISPLQPFTSKEFSKLTEEIDDPTVYAFNSPSPISDNFRDITKGYYTAYSPNGKLNTENFTELTGNSDLDLKKIKEVLSDDKRGNIVSVISIPNRETRFKRDIENNTEITETITDTTETEKMSTQPSNIPEEPVIYSAQNSKTKLFALLYSSRPLLLKRNGTELPLENTNNDMIIYDNRLNVNIPIKGGKITLRFSFVELNGYWYMPLVKFSEINSSRDINLTTDKNIMAARKFSYHCNGVSIYSDGNGIELHIFDLQVQMDTPSSKFGDAYDCVPFITVPICTGLLVTALFAIGLILSLTAIMDIKTMDKFDNYKTKNLNITVSE